MPYTARKTDFTLRIKLLTLIRTFEFEFQSFYAEIKTDFYEKLCLTNLLRFR
jgi:hypothetical protein